MIILGIGSHAADIRAIAHRCNIHNITEYDDLLDCHQTPPDCLRGPLMVGVNNPAQRREIAKRWPHVRGAAPLIDPSAIIGPDVHCGYGSVVAPMATLLTRVRLGAHVHVNYHASMTRCTIGDYTTVSPGAVICGDVTIGQAVLIGAGAVVADRCVIGDDVIIAAGAIVPPESVIPDGAKCIGVWKP